MIKVVLEDAATSDTEFGAVPIDFVSNEVKLLNSVLEHPRFNFVLVPSSKRGSLHVLHHCSVYEDEGSGMLLSHSGTKRTEGRWTEGHREGPETPSFVQSCGGPQRHDALQTQCPTIPLIPSSVPIDKGTEH